MKPLKRGAYFALAACLCLAALPLASQSRTGQSNSKGSSLLSSPSSGKSSSSSGRLSSTSGKTSSNSREAPGKKGLFDIATSSNSGTKNSSVAPAVGRTTTKASPFGTTSQRAKSSSTRRWKTTTKLVDCIRDRTIPSNTNFTFSGTIVNTPTDGRYTILTMFDSVSITTESGAVADVPVTFTVVMDAEVAGTLTLKPGSRKSLTVDSNYVYFVWDDSGCTVRVVDNSLTEQDQITPNNNSRTSSDKSSRTTNRGNSGNSDITF